jgi:hypothetical protein
VFFAIYEPSTQKGSWVKAGETGSGYVVRSYDEANNAVSVEYQGRLQTLTLKEAKFDGTAPVAPMIVQQPMVMPNAPQRPPGGPAVAPTPADEAARLQQVANEVKRRRAARQAATQTQSGQNPAPATPATP